MNNIFANKKKAATIFLDAIENNLIVTKNGTTYQIFDDSEKIYSIRNLYDLFINESNIDINFSWELFCELFNEFISDNRNSIFKDDHYLILKDPHNSLNEFVNFIIKRKVDKTIMYVFETSFDFKGSFNVFKMKEYNSEISFDISLDRNLIVEYKFKSISSDNFNNDDFADSFVDSLLNCIDIFLSDKFVYKNVYKRRTPERLNLFFSKTSWGRSKKLKTQLDQRRRFSSIDFTENINFINYIYKLYDMFYSPDDYLVDLDLNFYLNSKDSSVSGIDVKNYNNLNMFTKIILDVNSKSDIPMFYFNFITVMDSMVKFSDTENRGEFSPRLQLMHKHLYNEEMINYSNICQYRNDAAHIYNSSKLLKMNDTEKIFEDTLNNYLPFLSKLISITSESIDSNDHLFIKYTLKLATIDSNSMDHMNIIPKIKKEDNKVIYKSLRKQHSDIKVIYNNLVNSNRIAKKIVGKG